MTSPPRFEVYVQVFEITEWRDGAVYRTESRGFRWVDNDDAKHVVSNRICVPLSTLKVGADDFKRTIRVKGKERKDDYVNTDADV